MPTIVFSPPDLSYKNHKSGDVPVYKRESMQLYHNMVLKNVIETEKAHVEEMTKVLQSYIKPILATNILSPSEYGTLIGNMEEIITFQQSFLTTLEDCEKLPLNQRRIGGIFMQFAPSMKELHSSYCSNHPKAVSLLQKRREELSKFVESQGASSPGAQALTTILSKPFVRLDKYPSLLKELERHVEESHPDRGDTQRAIAVYKNIANSCLDIRKLKEMEHEIITSTIQGWEGEEISKLGEVIHLSQVKMITQTGEKFERIFVLFPSCLVMLSMSSRLSSYQYEVRETWSENTYHRAGPMIEKITVLCGTRLEVTAWLDILRQQLSQSGYQPPPSSASSSAKPQPMQMHMISTCQPSVISTVTPAKTAQISSSLSSSPANAASTNILNNNVNSNNPALVGPSPPHFPPGLMAKGGPGAGTPIWSLTCLRPSPPLRPTLMCREEVLKSPRAARKSTHKRKPVRTYSGEEADWYSKQHDPKVYNEDAFILQVIEAYCNSIKTRHTVNSCKIEVASKKAPDVGKGKGM
ncbi:rho guanine nucleotide exchange factor 7 [Elysia marginata]|uniref:Rho guanine nucleotide exchange factor 7 n=1 Tax=Elysia marginata TaxID=1093978 RepID=A0AAV4H8G0_9GAST|nr:rho guanine nucleotide exchange factor 7 [Elysia marginata]